MQITKRPGGTIEMSMTETELEGIAQSFNEVCNGFTVHDFEKAIGADENTVMHLLNQFRPRHRSELSPLAIPVHLTVAISGENKFTVEMAPNEGRIIINCLNETLREIRPSEYQTRMGIGFGVEKATQIISGIEAALK